MNQNARTVVELSNISKRFGKVVAIEQLDIDIRAGEFVTFLGPSGCGKSTTLRILGGFEQPDTGRILLDGVDVTRLPPNKRNVNMVFQDYALFPHMSVTENIDFGLELKGLTRSAIQARRQEVMSFLELEQLGARFPEQLSGGQRQRVALARALAPDPALLLLDEPLGALDARLRSQVQQELKAIQRRTNTTFFFVTHDQDEALTMSDRIVVMNQGKVEQDGTPEELYQHPSSRFVAEFIGDTNLLTGSFVGMDGPEAILDWGGQQLRAYAGSTRVAAGAEVTASLRLEKVICTTEQPDSNNAVRARIVDRVFKGSRTALTVRIEGQLDAELKAYVDADQLDRNGGDQLWVSWASDNLSLLQQ